MRAAKMVNMEKFIESARRYRLNMKITLHVLASAKCSQSFPIAECFWPATPLAYGSTNVQTKPPQWGASWFWWLIVAFTQRIKIWEKFV